MNKKQRQHLISENIGEIINYQTVLSNILKKKVTLDQAIADWIEQGYNRMKVSNKIKLF